MEKTHSQKNKLLTLFILILNFVSVGIETDIYVPSFPDIMNHFKTSEAILQMLLSMNFIGLCCSGLIYGPLSDAWGRKKTLLSGAILFFAGSVGCVIAHNIEIMIFWRFIQGVGGGALMIVTAATLFDLYSNKEATKLLGILNGIIAASMAIAPMIGSWVGAFYGWRMNFAIVAALSVLCLVFLTFFFHESLVPKKRTPFSFGGTFRNYGILLSNFEFTAKVMIFTFLHNALIIYTANLSLIFISHMDVEPTLFGYYQSSIMAVFMAFSILSAKGIDWYGPYATKKAGLIIGLLGAALLVYLSYRNSSPLLITIAMCIVSAGVALSMGIFGSQAMDVFPEVKGASAALICTVRLCFISIVISLTSLIFDGTMIPIAWVVMGYMIAAAGLYGILILQDHKKIHKND